MAKPADTARRHGPPLRRRERAGPGRRRVRSWPPAGWTTEPNRPRYRACPDARHAAAATDRRLLVSPRHRPNDARTQDVGRTDPAIGGTVRPGRYSSAHAARTILPEGGDTS